MNKSIGSNYIDQLIDHNLFKTLIVTNIMLIGKKHDLNSLCKILNKYKCNNKKN